MSVAPVVLRIPALADDAGFVHGFSTMAIGSVGLTHAPDPVPVLASRRSFARVLGIDSELTTAGAVHGRTVTRVDEPVDVVQRTDGLVTDRRGVALFATFADCYPIVLWDPVHRAVGLAHAGWRGTQAGIAGAAVAALAREYGSEPRHIRAGIGPGICGSCYEVGEDVASRFDARFARRGTGDRFLLDLAAANLAQLEAAGVSEVHSLGLCTKESSVLPSHRGDPDGTRFGAIVALR